MSNIVNTSSVEYHTNVSKKPMYLISLADKTKTQLFITLDKPSFLNNFIETKGFFVDENLEDILKNFLKIVEDFQTNKKEQIMEIMFPVHKINSIRSLFFKAK